jgi:hypothetical protein
MSAMKAALNNALVTIEDEDDGIVAEIKRQEFLQKSVNNKAK